MPKKQTSPKALTRHRNRGRKKPASRLGQVFVASMFIVGSLVGGIQTLKPVDPRTLAYATNVSHGGLLAGTNQNRSAHGLTQLSLNGQLNAAAQSKANDMAAKDYWSHTSPDGRQPWDFITATGYSYAMAGENLAYGALTSDATVQAWMNSPGHRANILKSEFRQVGFGYANAENYQGSGQQTVIVAMYAAPYAPAPVPAPAPVKPVSAPTPKPSPIPVATPAKPANTKPAPKPPAATTKTSIDTAKEPAKEDVAAVAPAEASTQPTQAQKSGEKTVTPPAEAQPIRRVALVTGNYSGWMAALALVVGITAGGVFLFRHSRAWHRRILKGEEFIVRHPLVDALAVMAIIVVVVLMQNVGHIL